jgi:hypothetical protein
MDINLKDKKYLITSGCSFTDGYNMGNEGSWPYYLSKMLNFKLINKARGGSGNEYIADSIIIELMNNEEIRNESVVIVAWSSNTRLMTPVFDGEYNVLDTVQPQDFIEWEKGGSGKYTNLNCGKTLFSDVPFCAYKTYLSILKLSSFLDSLNIPYVYLDAISQSKVELQDAEGKQKIILKSYADVKNVDFDLRDYPHQYKHVFNQKFNDNIFKNFIEVKRHSSILDFMWTDYDNYTKGNPGHPNDIASKQIAESIYEQIK